MAANPATIIPKTTAPAPVEMKAPKAVSGAASNRTAPVRTPIAVAAARIDGASASEMAPNINARPAPARKAPAPILRAAAPYAIITGVAAALTGVAAASAAVSPTFAAVDATVAAVAAVWMVV